MTACLQASSNSVEPAPTRLQTFLANSTTANWNPRHKPRNGRPAVASVSDARDFPFDASRTESARDDETVNMLQGVGGSVFGDFAGFEPIDIDFDAGVRAGMFQRLDDGRVTVPH